MVLPCPEGLTGATANLREQMSDKVASEMSLLLVAVGSHLGSKDTSSPSQTCPKPRLTSQWLSSLVSEMSMLWCCSLSSSKRACQRFSSSWELFRDVFSSLVWACSSSYSPFSWWCRKLTLRGGEPQAKGLRSIPKTERPAAAMVSLSVLTVAGCASC